MMNSVNSKAPLLCAFMISLWYHTMCQELQIKLVNQLVKYTVVPPISPYQILIKFYALSFFLNSASITTMTHGAHFLHYVERGTIDPCREDNIF